jgi:hypothetical protein
MNTKYLAILLSGAATHFGAWAHEGHGLAGSAHWHATDTLGFVGLAVVAAAVWYINKRK